MGRCAKRIGNAREKIAATQISPHRTRKRLLRCARARPRGLAPLLLGRSGSDPSSRKLREIQGEWLYFLRIRDEFALAFNKNARVRTPPDDRDQRNNAAMI